MGRKTIREDIRKKEAALKRAENMIRELEELHRTKTKDLEQKIIETEIEKCTFKTELEEKKKEAIEKEEELRTLRSLLKEKDRDIERFRETLKDREQELNGILSKKNLEIAEIKAELLTTKNELQLIKKRTFRQRLRACFLTASNV